MSAWNPYAPRSNDLPALERIAVALERVALAIEARSAGTGNTDPARQGKSAGPKGNAQPLSDRIEQLNQGGSK